MKNVVFLLFGLLVTTLSSQDVIYILDEGIINNKRLEVTRDFVPYNNQVVPMNAVSSMGKQKIEKFVYDDVRKEWIQGKSGLNIPAGNPRAGKESQDIEPDSENKLHFGVFGGITSATGIYDYKGQTNPPAASVSITPAAGILMDWDLANKISLRTTLAYRGKGDRIDVGKWTSSIEPIDLGGDWETTNLESDGFIRTYVGYAELALLPVFRMNKTFRWGIGGYLAAGLHGKEKSDYVQTITLNGDILNENIVETTRTIEFSTIIGNLDSETARYFNRIDYGFIAYAGFGKRPVTFGISFNLGRVPWEPEDGLFGSSFRTTETYHISALLGVNYWLK